ncbi:MAG: hypothetical protein ABIR68_03325 [Ilumatobacteraceae bacterium]
MTPGLVEGQSARMPERVNGVVDLWDGWSLALPNDCMCERNVDGSWSAWDASRTVDVQIVTVVGTAGRESVSAEAMLGREPNARGEGWSGYVEERVEPDVAGTAYRLTIAAAGPDTLLSCWVAYRSDEDRPWANEVLSTIVLGRMPT